MILRYPYLPFAFYATLILRFTHMVMYGHCLSFALMPSVDPVLPRPSAGLSMSPPIVRGLFRVPCHRPVKDRMTRAGRPAPLIGTEPPRSFIQAVGRKSARVLQACGDAGDGAQDEVGVALPLAVAELLLVHLLAQRLEGMIPIRGISLIKCVYESKSRS